MPSATGAYVTTALLKTRANIPDTADDTLVGQIVDEVNQWVETFTGRALAPLTYTAALFDGWAYPWGSVVNGGRALLVPRGVRTITNLEIAPTTGGAFTSITADALMRPTNLETNEPATRIVLSDHPAGAYSRFPGGYANIRLNGTGGPAAIPDDVRAVAIAIAVRAWNGRQSGHTDIVGNDQLTGNPVVSRWVASEDKQTLMRYQPALVY